MDFEHSIVFTNNNNFGKEMLKISKDGFYVNGVKVEQGPGEAENVYKAFTEWLVAIHSPGFLQNQVLVTQREMIDYVTLMSTYSSQRIGQAFVNKYIKNTDPIHQKLYYEEDPKVAREMIYAWITQQNCKHCWHGTGVIFTTYPAQHPQYCCLCNATQTLRDKSLEPNPFEHGQFLRK